MHSHPVESESLLIRDASKRKRVNRTAKLKQFKLDARREQWLAHGKQQQATAVGRKGSAEEDFCHTGDSDAESCVINQDDLCDGQIKGMSDCNFVSNSISYKGDKDIAGSPVEVPVVVNPEDTKKGKGKRRPGRVKSRVVDSYDGDSEPLSGGVGGKQPIQDEDDWEAAADALNCQINLNKEPSDTGFKISDTSNGDCKCDNNSNKSGTAAWKPDDVSRPVTLPRVQQQQQQQQQQHPQQQHHPQQRQRQWQQQPSRKANAWGVKQRQKQLEEQQVQSCPICTEELDSTDSSFHPCSCGFRLCLFCHHKIAVEDGRCPGCRKTYTKITTSNVMSKPMMVMKMKPVPSL